MTEQQTQFYGDMGRVIQWGRKRAGLTQAAVAGALGVDRTTVVKWEAGRQVVAAHWVPEISCLLGVTVAHLVGGLTRPRAVAVARPDAARKAGGA
jgi:DNA-binding XRE family transcriptional regulator